MPTMKLHVSQILNSLVRECIAHLGDYARDMRLTTKGADENDANTAFVFASYIGSASALQLYIADSDTGFTETELTNHLKQLEEVLHAELAGIGYTWEQHSMVQRLITDTFKECVHCGEALHKSSQCMSSCMCGKRGWQHHMTDYDVDGECRFWSPQDRLVG